VSEIAGNPYPGSRAFTEADQAFFHGRAAAAEEVTGLWRANRLTIVSGPAGCGKTSLLHAGVYPSMREHRPRLIPAGDLYHGLTFPVPALAEHNPFTLALLRSWSPDDVPTRLAGLTISDFLDQFARGRNDVIHAAIDQVDDLLLGSWTGPWAAWRRRFLDELTQAIADHPRLHLLLVTRGAALSLLTSVVGDGAPCSLSALAPESAIEAMTVPAAGAGRSFTAKAARVLADDLRGAPEGTDSPADDHVEPVLLQAVCHRLWENLPPDVTEISDGMLREYGDPDTALAAHCGHVIGEVAALHGRSSRALRSRLVDSFVTRPGNRGGVHEDTLAEAGLPGPVLRDLVDRHLLASQADGSKRYYRLLARRLAEPLRMASPQRSAAVTPEDHLRAAGLALARGDLDLAQSQACRACELIPDPSLREAASLQTRAQAESLLGNVTYRRDEADGPSGDPGALDQARARYRRAAELLQALGDTRAAAYHLAAAGRLQLLTGEAADALPAFRAAVERVPSDLGLRTQLAIALWQAGDGQTAVGILNWVLTMDGGYEQARRARGEILADLGEARSAMLDLDRAAPDHPASRAARGLALAELGDHTAAAAEVNGALADARRSGPVLLYAARALDLAGDTISAKHRAQEAIDATDPPLFQAHKKLARKLADQRREFPERYRASS
jgi:tetratricopeptide (TPR) repeat protein